MQDFDNNGDFWNRLEIYCRDLTKKFSSVHVISGPMWLAKEPTEKHKKLAEEKHKETGYKMKPPKKISHYVRGTFVHVIIMHTVQSMYMLFGKLQVIGDNEVSVPTHLYKVVVAEREEGRRKRLFLLWWPRSLCPTSPYPGRAC